MPNTPAIPSRLYYGDEDIRAEILNRVAQERRRHRALGFHVDMTDLAYIRTHVEELGEAAQALEDAPGEVDKELVQLAASVVAHLEMRAIRRISAQWSKKGWDDKLAHLPACPVRLGTGTAVCICFECGNCDGCGWVEGGKALKTTCRTCKGRGVVRRKDA